MIVKRVENTSTYIFVFIKTQVSSNLIGILVYTPLVFIFRSVCEAQNHRRVH